jgi:ParB-like chromosome segregation protein Spo0J
MRFHIQVTDEVYKKLKHFSDSTGFKLVDITRYILKRFADLDLPTPGPVKSLSKLSTLDLTLELDANRHELYLLRQEQQNLQKQIEKLSHNLTLLCSTPNNNLPLESSQGEAEIIDGKVKKRRGRKKRSIQEKKDGETLPLNEIKIPPDFLKSPPRKEGLEEVIEYYNEHGCFDKPVVIRKKDMLIIDGYKRYVAAEKIGLNDIPVKYV